MQNFEASTLERKIDQLTEIISDISSNSKQSKAFLNIREVSELTGFTVGTLYNKVWSNDIPHFKKGSKLFFVKEDVINWIKSE